MSGSHTKRRKSFNPDQLGFAFDAPEPAMSDGDLAGIERRVSSATALMLNHSGESRHTIAGEMSRLLDDEVTKFMLDAYASESREGHNISFGRFLALVCATHRYDVLDKLLREVGAAVVVGEEIVTVELGHIRRQQQLLAQREAELRKVAPLVGSKGGRK